MKKFVKLISVILIFSLVMSLGVLSAFATGGAPAVPDPATPVSDPKSPLVEQHRYQGNDDVHELPNPEDPRYLTDITGGVFFFKKFLVLPKGVEVPNAKFTFKIDYTSGMTYNVAGKVFEIYSTNPADGKVSGTPTFTVDTATFAPGDTVYTEIRKDRNVQLDYDVERLASDRDKNLTAATGVEWEPTTKNEVYAVTGDGDRSGADADLKIDFTGVTFFEPGVYRYIITEQPNDENAKAGIMHDNQSWRVLDIYVTDTNNNPVHNPLATGDHPEGELHVGLYDNQIPDTKVDANNEKVKITGYVLHKGDDKAQNYTNGEYIQEPTISSGADMGTDDVSADGDRLAYKTDGFTNEYKPYNLVIAKQVTGNQGSRDKYFKYTLTLSNVLEGSKFVVSYSNDDDPNTVDGYADQTIPEKPNAATTCITAAVTQPMVLTIPGPADPANPAKVSFTQVFYLQHEQAIAIRGLPGDAGYSLIEDQEDYKMEGAKATLTRVANVKGDYKNLVKTDTTTPTIADVDKLDRDGATSKWSATKDERDHVVYTSYLNTRNGTIPTGIITVIGPAVAMIVLATLGLSVVLLGRRRREQGAE